MQHLDKTRQNKTKSSYSPFKLKGRLFGVKCNIKI